MAANTQPIFIRQPFLAVVTLDTSKFVPRSGTNIIPLNLPHLIEAGDNGCLVEAITIIPILNSGNMPANTLRIFHVGENGIMSMIFPDIELPAISNVNESTVLPAKSVQLYDVLIGDIGRKGLRLGPKDRLYATLGQELTVGAYNVVATGGFY